MSDSSTFTLGSSDAVYEPFVVDGAQVGEVSWLRQEGADSSTLLTGLWRCEPSEFPYAFSLDETFVILSGALDVHMSDGQLLELRVGDTASFVKGSASTWTVRESVVKFFVVSD